LRSGYGKPRAMATSLAGDNASLGFACTVVAVVRLRNRIRVAIAFGVLPILLGSGATPSGELSGPPVPQPGYHHLGATSDGTWSGVLGRLTVEDPSVRAGTFDFVATRFMAKASTDTGVKWLEAGWAETGWADPGTQRIYTYDTNTDRWTFYDQYPVKAGDQVWIEIAAASTGPDPVWNAWLWWHDSWHLLTSQALPISEHATIEEYVEVYVDPVHPGSIAVPPVQVDNVGLKPDPKDPPQPWSDAIPTAAGDGADGYCLDFVVPYSTWRAGTC